MNTDEIREKLRSSIEGDNRPWLAEQLDGALDEIDRMRELEAIVWANEVEQRTKDAFRKEIDKLLDKYNTPDEYSRDVSIGLDEAKQAIDSAGID